MERESWGCQEAQDAVTLTYESGGGHRGFYI